jgi:hypothetical protein
MFWARRIAVTLVCVMGISMSLGLGAAWAERDTDQFSADERTFSRTAASSVKERDFRTPVAAGAITVTILGFLACGVVFIARKIRQPYSISIEPLEAPELSEFMIVNSEKLVSMGFTHRLDFTIPELPHKGFFRLFGTKLNERAVMLHEIQSGSAAKLNKQYVNYVEFRTFLDNGMRVQTNNVNQHSGLKPKPDQITIRYPGISDIQALYNQHRADVDHTKAHYGGRVISQPLDSFSEQFPADWKSLMAYEMEQGLVKKSEDPGIVVGTSMLVLRSLAPAKESASLAWLASLVGAVVLLAVLALIRMAPEAGGPSASPAALYGARPESVAILVIALITGFVVGSGGVITGLLVYLPSLILLETGPLGYFLPIALAYMAGSSGAKLRRLPDRNLIPVYKFLSPDIYITVLLFLVAGLT